MPANIASSRLSISELADIPIIYNLCFIFNKSDIANPFSSSVDPKALNNLYIHINNQYISNSYIFNLCISHLHIFKLYIP